jgi:outer membrane receptor protein involved in Fe transport
MRALKVEPARETTIAAISLEVASVRQSVEVTADAQTVQTANAEISNTVTNEQVRRLPLLDRDPLSLILTQAGVVSNGRASTVINGQRSSYSNMTLDGINIQDNYIRDDAVDYSPNMPLIDQVSEITVATSNSNSSFGGGSSQVVLSTPSGTNELHGKGYWYNRNNFFAANEWFNNKDGVDKPFLNQNQIGGGLGGPIKKDKLFFYTNYEAYRQKQQESTNRTILTADARQGIFTYRDTRNVVQKIDVLKAYNVQADAAMQQLLAQVPGADKINNYDVGDSGAGLVRNTAGYRFNTRSNRTRDNFLTRIDYNLSKNHIVTGTYLWNRDNSDRPDYENDYSLAPKATNTNHSNLMSLGWRWSPSAQWTNELRGGFNFAPGEFPTSEKFGNYIVDGMSYSNPVNTGRAQGRSTNTYSLSDNAAWARGRHSIQFGFQTQRIGVRYYDENGITPTFTIGMGTGNLGLTSTQLPLIRRADLDSANQLLASLAGFVTSYSQQFNITNRTSGFVPGAGYVRHYDINDYAFYAQDTWKIRPRVTLTLGVRYTLYSPANEPDSLLLMPVIQNGDIRKTLLSNSTLDFAGSSATRPLYQSDKNNFAPNVGLAWDVFGTGKTAVRAGYSINFVNDQALLGPTGVAEINDGLKSLATDYGLSNIRVSSGLPKIVAPGFQVPRTFEDNYNNDSTSAFGLTDPNLRTPYVQQWSIGIQQQYKGTIFEGRYVGNHTVGGYRAFDYNQVVIRDNGFLDDFKRARSNGFLAKQVTGTFNPAYDAKITGSQQLPVFGKLYRTGQLNNALNRSLIESGEVGELAANYQIDGNNGTVNFFQNPYGLGADYLTNYSNSTYNSFQFEVRRRTKTGLDVQGNYTFSKVLSDSAGTSQSRLEHFLDLANTKIERARADFDLTHALKATAVYELPLMKRSRWLGGWALSGIMIWQSGTPFSILSQRGTLNRASGTRSDLNTANSSLNKAQLNVILQFHMTGDGPVFVPAQVKGPDGRAVAADGDPNFAGQVFSNPDAGNIGALQRRMFSGPWTFNLDMGVLKTTKITERQSLEFRMETTNAPNHPQFLVGDQNINSVEFGKITDTLSTSRRVQFGLYYRF